MSARGDSITRRDSIQYNPPGEFNSLPVGGYWSVGLVADANRRAGFHFFDADAKRFFGSRIGANLYGGRFFVTSEQDSGPYAAWNGERRYTIRFARRDGSIETVREFGYYASSQAANKAAKRAAHLYRLRAGRKVNA